MIRIAMGFVFDEKENKSYFIKKIILLCCMVHLSLDFIGDVIHFKNEKKNYRKINSSSHNYQMQ